MKYCILFLGLIFVLSCNKKVTTVADNARYRDKAYEVLGAPQVQFYKNKPEDYVLATYQQSSDISGSEPIHYAVIRIADNEVVYEKTMLNGSVRWADDYVLEIIDPPGITQGNKETIADYTSQFNVKTGKQVRQSGNTN